MGFNCGIVGLPNVGKSTIFNAITQAGAKASNFPFCTIDPNVGIVSVPDKRLDKLLKLVNSEKKISTTLEFVDIAGLVKGASKGEGLGNKFLSHIRRVDAIAHVVRCFDDDNIIHSAGKVSPVDDIEIINTELILADLETVEKGLQRIKKGARSGDSELSGKKVILEKVQKELEKGKKVTDVGLLVKELQKIKDFHLLTSKKIFYVCNVNEDDIANGNQHVDKVKLIAEKEKVPLVIICGKIESEIAELNEEEKISFLADYGLTESGLDKMIHTGYSILHLITFFTAGPKEVRAWTIFQNSLAPKAAGTIHTDFERGFIKAEVISYEDYLRAGSENSAKEKGLMRLEGKEYIVKDGDIMHFKFNV